MQKCILVLFGLFLLTSISGQEWESSVNTNISFSGNEFAYDLIGNEIGFHLAVCESNQLKYYHLAADGSILSQSTIASSGAASPAITWQDYNGSKMHIVYHDKTNHYIKIAQSTNDGETWSSLDDEDIEDYFGNTSTALRIDAIAQDDEFLHITIGDARSSETGIDAQTSSDKDIYFTSYDLDDGEWALSSTELTYSLVPRGWNPTIALSEKNNIDRIHVVFETDTTISGDEDSYVFERIVERHLLSTLSNWTPRDIINKSPEDPFFVQAPHLSANFSYPVCSVYSENLFIASRYENTDSVSGTIRDHYYTIVKKRAVDDTTNLNSQPSGYLIGDSSNEDAFGISHSLHTGTNGNSDSLLWANIRDDELVFQKLATLSPSFTFTDTTYISEGTLPMLTSNMASEAFVVWKENSKVWVKRKPRSISGTISKDTQWSGNVYIEGDVTVNSGVTLTILPNTEVHFADSDSESGGSNTSKCELIINGELLADEVTFESENSTKGGWQGIYFENGSDSDSYLNYCTIEDAYYGIHTYEDITIDSTEFNNIDCIGIKVLGEAEPTVTDCKITADAVGIYIYRGSGTYQYNDFEGPFTETVGSAVYALGSDNTDFSYCNFDLETTDNNGTYNKYTTSIDVTYSNMDVPGTSHYYMKEVSGGPASTIAFSYLGCSPASVDPNDFYGDVNWSNIASSVISSAGTTWKKSVSSDYWTARELMRAKDYQGAYDMLMALASDSKTDNKSECFQLAMQASKKMDTFKDQENIIKEFLGNADTDVQNAAEVWLSIYYEHINDFDKAQKILDNTKLIGEYKLSMLFNLAAAYDDADYDDKALAIFHQMIKEFPEEEKEILEIIREMHNGSNNSDGDLNKPTTESIVPEYFTTAYPNPFNASTTIAYNVPNTGHVRICVYDILGREVKTLVDDVIEQGQNTITWNGANDLNMPVATGVYFYRVQLEDHILTNKILMLR